MLQLSEIKLFGNDAQTFSTIKPTVTASGENAPDDIKANLVDGSSNTKWLTWNNTAWLQIVIVSARVELGLAMEQRTSFAGLKIRNIADSFVL